MESEGHVARLVPSEVLADGVEGERDLQWCREPSVLCGGRFGVKCLHKVEAAWGMGMESLWRELHLAMRGYEVAQCSLWEPVC